MNQGVVHSSVPVQQMVAATTPTWWSINNMKPPSHNQQHSFLAAPPHNYFPGHHHLISSASWNDHSSLQEPESWSQLLLGGSVGEVDKPGFSHKRIENWEQQFLNQSSHSSVVDVIKLDNSANNYTNCWSQSHQMLSASSASPKSCVTTLSSNLLDFTQSQKSPDPQLPDPSISECNSTSTGGVAKKARIQSSSAHQSTFKVRKEKLGDRITVLHQLVSPFGKTDTASVLLEAIGYIRFLQSQVEALSLPYLQGTGTRNNISQPHQVQGNRNNRLFPQFPVKELSEEDEEEEEEQEEEGKKEKKDLKSRGLCLVPISSTLHFGSDNGADYWAPAFGGNFQ